MNDGKGRLVRYVLRGASTGLVAIGLIGCAGSQQPANEPGEPPLDSASEGGETTPASSAKVQEGMDAIQAQDFATAKAVLTEAQAANPTDPQAAYYLGVAHEGLGELEAAQTQYEKAIELDPGLIEAAINLSGVLIDTGQGEAAVKVVEAALEKAPADKKLLTNHALALEAAGDTAGAVTAYGKAVEAVPDDVQLRTAYVQLLAAEGSADEAKAQIAKLGGVKDPALARALAQVELKLGMLDECVSLLDGAIASHATPDLHLSRATCKYAKKDMTGAEKDYRSAIALDPNFAPGYFYLGVLLEKQGKKAEAKKAFQKVVETGKGTPAEKAAQQKLDAL
jgi:Flp pilus assembly protein TadD